MNTQTEQWPYSIPSAPAERDDTLRERYERLELAVTAAQVGTWAWDIVTGQIHVDSLGCSLLGIAGRSFQGSYGDFLALVHPEDRVSVQQGIGEAVRELSTCDVQCRVVWKQDGTVHSVRVRGSVQGVEGGRALGMTGACWDITERRRAETELAHERQLLGCLMENLPDRIYFKDAQSRFICVNKAKLAKHGLTSMDEIIGMTDFDLFNPTRAKSAFEDEQRIMQTGEPLVGKEEQDIESDGTETWVSTTKMPLRDTKGGIVGTFGLSRDVTARKRAELALEISAELLRRKNAELQEDLEMARELQTALLPQQYPRFPHDAEPGKSALRFSHFFNPSAEVSGDFFDILPISDSQAGIFICDVMGHGVRAAMVAAIVRTLVEESRGRTEKPGEFMTRVNHALCGALKPTPTPIFVSAFFAVADLKTGDLHYANAAHPSPLCLRHGLGEGSVFGLSGGKPGPALGLFDSAVYETWTARLAKHDVLMLFTDGLFEVESATGEFYDEKRLKHAVERRLALSAEALCTEIVREIRDFSASKNFTDDVCLVTMEIDHLGD